MDVEFVDKEGSKMIHHRLGPMGKNTTPKVCFHWQEGRCTRINCPFLHNSEAGGIDGAGTNNGFNTTKRSNQIMGLQNNGGPFVQRRPISSKWGRGANAGGVIAESRWKTQGKVDKICNFWMSGNCRFGSDCKFLHSFFVGEGFTFVTLLSGHEKAVRGIAFPSGSDKLYSGSLDESVRIWDCQTGRCTLAIKLPGEVGCMISEGPLVFVGIPNFVMAWNIQTASDLTLSGPVGQDGSILAWKFNVVSNSFEPAVL